MDLQRKPESNVISTTFELPGVRKEDVHINLQDGFLTIDAQSSYTSSYEEPGSTVREQRFGKISRTMQLPPGINEDDVKASVENGVLTVMYPKPPAREIPIA
ncbi:HSP20-like chaperone [Coprinopsis marcescibilis]|uniref:HSP20-like chaperone n=1 Tax=Coprinopsis marcescibilis TaxID=230819 RepID=A0A5C3L0Y1_COPMA|nr:HSP20-like chaperone [Coprinopsis marcescibilis]